ncbi:MAG TPA: adenine phosphoribosyltransferase [Desulfobacteraceae bacterium]|nr:adenine phosphoribosyltransferase [Desulfobacteraceae bacterium]
MDTFLGQLEEGKKYLFEIPEIGFSEELPYVLIPIKGGHIKIASLNLIGMIGWNKKFGRTISGKIKVLFPDLNGIVFLSAVEKSLQLTQIVCQELDIPIMAIAYNRKKPHMEIDCGHKRPFIQVGGGSVTSGDKYLYLYERDVNLISTARKGIIIVDDVISTGGTVAALATILDEICERRSISKDALKIQGIFCVAREGSTKPLYKGLSRKIHWLGVLPEPEFIPESTVLS